MLIGTWALTSTLVGLLPVIQLAPRGRIAKALINIRTHSAFAGWVLRFCSGAGTCRIGRQLNRPVSAAPL